MAVVPISDMAIRLDTARYAYREVLEIYDLKIKDLIPDTPSDTFRLITSHLKEHKKPINAGPSKPYFSQA